MQAEKFDVIVVGGGFSGVAAAIGAARQGAKTMLIEKSNALGGAATNALVNPFMKHWTKKDGKTVFLNRGIFEEIVNNLEKMNAISGKSFFQDEALKLILNRMVLSENIKLRFHSQLLNVEADNGKLHRITVLNNGGQEKFSAKYFIDATGDGTLAAMSGCEYEIGREEDGLCQAMSLCFRVINADNKKFFASMEKLQAAYADAKKQGKINNPRHNICVTPYFGDGNLEFNTTRIVGLNPLDADDITKAEIEAREQVFEIFNFMKENADGFENAELFVTASSIGVRESRRIMGEYMLTAEDITSCRKFDDAIAAGNYDIDIHNPTGEGTYHYAIPDGDYYTIPLRCLIPKGTQNILVAGRCISATHEAMASIRIMPIVCCIGEAAGIAAGIANSESGQICDISAEKIQAILAKEYN